MKKIFMLALGIVLSILLIGCGGEKGAGEQKKIKVKIANTQGEKDTQSIGMVDVKKRLEESGLFEVELFFSSSLGGTDDVLEQGIQGVPVIAMSDPGRLATYVKEYGIIQMPYILKDPEQLDRLIETELYKNWEKEFEKYGVKIITSNWYNGPRNFVTNKKIDVPKDLNGLKIRTIGSELFTESIKAMGAVPTPMEWSEVYAAIQQGALDGCEAQTPSVYPTRLYEICKYLNKTEHFDLITVPVMGADVFNSWSKEAQDTFVKAFEEAGRENRKIVANTIEEYEKEMAEKGMIINKLDQNIFKDAVEPVYDKLGYRELKEELLKQLGN